MKKKLPKEYHYHLWRETGGGWICMKCEINLPGYFWRFQLPKMGIGEIFDEGYLKYRRGD